MARYLETSNGRFTTIDPLAEKYPSVSPYVYCAGDPVNAIDPNGKYIDIVYSTADGNKAFRYNGSSESIPNNSFVRDVISMYENNKNNWENSGQEGDCPSSVLVESADIGLYVYQGHGVTEYSRMNGGIPYIMIDPYAGTKTDNGTILSPATLFAHEADHAYDDLTNNYAHVERRSKKLPYYTNAEEKRVITGSEQP